MTLSRRAQRQRRANGCLEEFDTAQRTPSARQRHGAVYNALTSPAFAPAVSRPAVIYTADALVESNSATPEAPTAPYARAFSAGRDAASPISRDRYRRRRRYQVCCRCALKRQAASRFKPIARFGRVSAPPAFKRRVAKTAGPRAASAPRRRGIHRHLVGPRRTEEWPGSGARSHRPLDSRLQGEPQSELPA